MLTYLKFSVLLVFTSLLLMSCASIYHAAEEGASGYRDLKISQDTYYVEYTEGAFTDWKKIHLFVLKRCAEIAKNQGYKFFDVISKDEKRVYLDSDVNEIVVSNMGNIANDPVVNNTYSTSGYKVEGRRVIYKIKLLNE